MEAVAKRPAAIARPKPVRTAKQARAAETPSGVSAVLSRDTAKIVPAGRQPVKRQRANAPEDMKTSTLHLRLKDGVKEDAAAILADAGISVSEAIRVFLGRIVSEGCLPFELEVPNSVTLRAMDEADRMSAARFQSAGELFDDLEKGGRS